MSSTWGEYNSCSFNSVQLILECLACGRGKCATALSALTFFDLWVQASRAVSNAMVLALGMGVGLLALTQAAGPSLLRAMGCQPEAFGPALEYLRVRSLSGTPSGCTRPSV